MNTTTIRAMLRAAIFTGAIAILPKVALADSGDVPTAPAETVGVPDHAQAEARTMGDVPVPTAEQTWIVPDHAQAEARGTGQTTMTTEEKVVGVPDHATAEDHGVDTDDVPQ